MESWTTDDEPRQRNATQPNMLRFLLLNAFLGSALAYGSFSNIGTFGGHGISGSLQSKSLGGFGSAIHQSSRQQRSSNMGGYTGSQAYSSGNSYFREHSYPAGNAYNGQVIPVAVQTRRSLAFVDVPSNSYESLRPLTIAIPATRNQLNFRMSSRSSGINIESHHEPGRGSYAETYSRDPAHIRQHTVTRPVVQKIREIITPYRKIRQEIQPLQEDVLQVVSRPQRQPAYGGSSGGSYGSGYSRSGY